MRPMPPLLLLDLDNTLIDRNSAFRGWAVRFLAEHRLPEEDLGWLTTLDCGGYFPRPGLFRAVSDRYGLHASAAPRLQSDYHEVMTTLTHCPAAHRLALASARDAGWTLGIVSNGATRQQEAKIRQAGLTHLVDGWVISDEAGCAKPDPLIFRIGAERCGLSTVGNSAWTEDAWMVGDHPPADIAGARLAGLRSVWLHHGRPWAELDYRPTLTAAGFPEAVAAVLAHNDPGTRRSREAHEAHKAHEKNREEHGNREEHAGHRTPAHYATR